MTNSTYRDRRDIASTQYKTSIEGLAECLVSDIGLSYSKAVSDYLQTIREDILEWAAITNRLEDY